MGRNRLRTYALVASVALLSTLVVVPAFGDAHLTDIDAVEFTAVDGIPRFEYGDLDPQVLEFERNTCAIADPAGSETDTILNLSSTGGAPGLNDNSIGVRANGKNANGTPCSQIDGDETLTITPGNQLTGALFSSVRLDLEMTGNATVVVSFADGGDAVGEFLLYTGTTAAAACSSDPGLEGCNGTGPVDGPYEVMSESDDSIAACASPSNSGPNSFASDNCIWTIEPGDDFDSITLEVQDVGTVSLEGGSDTGANNTTLFYVAPDRLFCGEPITFGENTDEPLYTVLAMNGLDEFGDPIPCEKGYTYSADLGTDTTDPSVTLETSGAGDVVFLERLEFRSQSVNWTGQLPTLYYDDDLSDGVSETAAQFCKTDPRALEGGEPVFDLAEAYDSAAEAGDVLPDDETTCIISADFVTTGSDIDGPLVQATYLLFNLNDGFRTFR